jgi:diamine N-acetyltransferase
MNHSKNNISLRAMEPEDLDLLYKIENDMEMWNISTANVPYSRYTLHDYIAQSAGDIFTDRQVRLIIEKDDTTPVGLVDLVNFDPRNRWCVSSVG